MKNDIRIHVYSIPILVADCAGACFASCQNALTRHNLNHINRIIITGCGYSYAAALAARDALVEMTGMDVIVTPAIEVSRFSHPDRINLQRTLLVGISNSGSVTRINEALALYRKHGATTIGITANLHSPISQYADVLLNSSSVVVGRSLPLRGYIMTYLNLLAIGISISKTDSQMILDSLIHDMEKLDAAMPEIDETIYQFALQQKEHRYEFVGSGFERAAAFLGKIEMMGQAGRMAVDEDCEQWCHCNFFQSSPEQIGTVLFRAVRSPGLSRSNEALQYMRHLGRSLCVATDDTSMYSEPTMTVVLLPDITIYNAGIVEMIVPSLLTGYACQLLDEQYSRGFRDQWSIFQDGRSTCQSELLLL